MNINTTFYISFVKMYRSNHSTTEKQGAKQKKQGTHRNKPSIHSIASNIYLYKKYKINCFKKYL